MLLVAIYVCLLVAPSAAGNQMYTRAELKEMLLSGLGNVEKETINAPVTVDHGMVPKWLHGNYMRHSCGAFGKTDHQNDSTPNYIQHLFDCFEIGSKFKIFNGTVTFTNRWFDTVVNDIYNTYGRDMNQSSVFLKTTFSKQNRLQVDKWQANISDVNKISEVPHVSWWKIGDDAIAMTENPPGVVVDPERVEQKGEMQFKDDWLGYPPQDGWSFTNNPAHEHMEVDGTLWSAVAVYKFANRTQIDMRRLVYKVGADKYRHVVGEYKYNPIDLSTCHGDSSYQDFDGRAGYLHSFCLTQNYIILPEAAYMFDPCVMSRYSPYKPFFLQGFTFEKRGYSRLLVMRKSDGKFVATIKTVPFFVTHQLGSYEDGELIHMDMLMYDDASIYDKHMYINSILGDNPYLTNVSRITINTTDWTVSIRNLRNGPPAALEMSNINYAYNGHKYTYGYMVKNFDQIFTNAITKLNVATGEETDYTLEDGLFVQEPQFIPRPTAVTEDDGVIIAQGVDGRKQKAFLVIVDAQTMTLMAHVTAPDLALLGLHERFYPISMTDGSTMQIIG